MCMCVYIHIHIHDIYIYHIYTHTDYIHTHTHTILGDKCYIIGLPRDSVIKNLPANAGDPGSIPGLESPPGRGNGTPLQYSCLENPMDRGVWWTTAHGSPRVTHD